MNPLTATLLPGPYTTQILATWNHDDCLRAVLPTAPRDPRAVTELLEALASWVGTPMNAAIAVDRQGRGGCAGTLFGGALLPDDTARVRFSAVPDRRPGRLRGPGDFRQLYLLHGRAS
jgi:hypothetical protein